MKKYRVLVHVTTTYALESTGETPEQAKKEALNRNPYAGQYLGSSIDYDVVDNEDFESTN